MKTFDKTDDTNKGLYNDRAYKILEADHAFDVGLYEEKKLKNGTVRKVKSKAVLKQKVIITFSRKMMEYQRFSRSRQIDRAKKLLKTSIRKHIRKVQMMLPALLKEYHPPNREKKLTTVMR